MKALICTFALGWAALAATADVRFENGWPVLRAGGQAFGQARPGPACDLQIDNARYPAASDAAKSDGASARYETAAGTIVDAVEPLPGMPGAFRRTLRFRNRTDRTLDLTGATFRVALPSAAAAPTWTAQSIVMSQVAGGTFAAAFSSLEDTWQLQVRREEGVLVAAHVSNAAWRLAPGAEAVVGSQYLWTVNAPLEAARKSTAEWYRAIGLATRANIPAWIHEAVLYEGSASGTLDSRFGDLGGFANLARHIDYLADMGVNSMWLLNPMTHKNGADPRNGWNHYDPLDYSLIDRASGGPEALAGLMAAMRQRGFHVLCEIVPHGGRAKVASNPELWTYGRDGARRIGFGQALDYSAPGWQEEMRKTVRWLTERFGFDGWRIDVADGYGVNWRAAHNLPHVSKSTRGGSIGMLEAIRAGAAQAGVNSVLLPETHVARPEFAPVSGLDYGFDLKFLVQREMLWTLSPAERVRKLRDFFRNQQHADPPGMVRLRAPDNHDTAGVLYGRGEYRFGVGLYRALLGVCSVVDGFPMVYQGQERGNYEHLRRIFHARRNTPELQRGASDYDAVAGPPEVFAVLRTHQGRHAIGLVNLSGKAIDGEFRLPGPAAAGEPVAHDAVSGRAGKVRGNRLEWHLAPYAVAVLRLGGAAVGAPPPERHRAESTLPSSIPIGEAFRAHGLLVKVSADRAVVRSERLPDGSTKVAVEGEPDARVSVEVDGVDRWYVQSTGGLYADRLLRRHYPWPEGLFQWEPGQLGRAWQPDRLWQSALTPLIAGGEIALAGTGGGGVRIGRMRTNAANLVLADSSMGLSGTSPAREDRYRCRLEWLGEDKHVNPRFTPLYLGRVWNVIRPRQASQRLHAEFVIAPSERIRLEDLDGYPAPEPGRASREFRSAGWTWSPHRIVTLDEPNTVTWRRLPLDEAGEYTLYVPLEHGRASADATELTGAYTIAFDGQRKSWSWGKLNALPRRGMRGYLGWAAVPLGRVQAGEHELKLETSRPGIVMAEDLFVSSDSAFRPY